MGTRGKLWICEKALLVLFDSIGGGADSKNEPFVFFLIMGAAYTSSSMSC